MLRSISFSDLDLVLEGKFNFPSCAAQASADFWEEIRERHFSEYFKAFWDRELTRDWAQDFTRALGRALPHFPNVRWAVWFNFIRSKTEQQKTRPRSSAVCLRFFSFWKARAWLSLNERSSIWAQARNYQARSISTPKKTKKFGLCCIHLDRQTDGHFVSRVMRNWDRKTHRIVIHRKKTKLFGRATKTHFSVVMETQRIIFLLPPGSSPAHFRQKLSLL